MANQNTKINKEIMELITKAKAGDISARNELLMQNVGLIKAIAKEVHLENVDYEDLVVDGYECFLNIIKDFDPEKCSYLSVFLWQRIKNYMYEKNLTKPVHLVKFATNVSKAKDTLCKNLERVPTSKEVADYLVVTEKLLNKRLRNLDEFSCVSLDAPIGRDEESEFSLMDTDLCSTEFSNNYNADYDVIREDTIKSIRKAWNRLPAEDRLLLKTRYPIDGEKISLRDAEKILNVSRETLRNREKDVKENFKNILEEYGICA